MRKSRKGRSVYLEVGAWLDDDGTIHLTSRAIEGFHVKVTGDAKRPNGHPTLYRRLVSCLREADAPAPAPNEAGAA